MWLRRMRIYCPTVKRLGKLLMGNVFELVFKTTGREERWWYFGAQCVQVVSYCLPNNESLRLSLDKNLLRRIMTGERENRRTLSKTSSSIVLKYKRAMLLFC